MEGEPERPLGMPAKHCVDVLSIWIDTIAFRQYLLYIQEVKTTKDL